MAHRDGAREGAAHSGAARLARLADHIAAALQHLSGEPGAVLAPCGVAAQSQEEFPIVAMFEAPAEDAVPKSGVEETFATHDLRVAWALEGTHQAPSDATVIVTVKKKIDAEVLDKFPKLKLIAVAFTGYDHVDLEQCRQRGVAVANVPGYSTDGVAELCFGLIFSLLRHIPIAHKAVREGKWAWQPGNELSGKSMGLIGTGQIGMRVGEIGKAFKVKKLLGYDSFKNPKFVENLGGEYVSSLATLFLHADILIVACALTKETRGLVSHKLLKLMRPDSIIINCARGAIIDQGAMTTMLGEGRFRAGLDVYEVEPLPADHALRKIPEDRLVTVPHLAYKCHESLRRRQDVTLANILAFLSENPQNIVS